VRVKKLTGELKSPPQWAKNKKVAQARVHRAFARNCKKTVLFLTRPSGQKMLEKGQRGNCLKSVAQYKGTIF